jgi:phage shock protein PspC (stress-responsive transcriptional regulator)
MNLMKSLFDFCELRFFGVCDALGKKLDMNSNRIRLSFVYLSFLTFGSPIVIYLVLHFWQKHSLAGFRLRKKNRIWELD